MSSGILEIGPSCRPTLRGRRKPAHASSGRTFRLAAALSVFLPTSVLASGPEHRIGKLTIKPEPNIEAMFALVQLSEAAEGMRPMRGMPPMHAKALKAFSSFKSHPAVKELNGGGLLEIGKSISEDAVYRLPLHFADLPDGKRIAEYSDEFLTMVIGPMPKAQKTRLLDEYWEKVRDFYRVSDLSRFLADNEKSYASFVEDIRQSLPQADIVSLYENYTGERGFDEYRVVPAPLLLPPGGAYGPTMSYSAPYGKVAFSILGTLYNNSAQEYNYRNKEFAQGTVVHEFGHSFCNPIVQANMEEGNKYAGLMKGVEKNLAVQGYPVWEAVLYEHLVRSVSARLTLAMDGEKAAEEALRKEREDFYFTFIDDFYAALAIYEKNRDSFPILRDFYPRLLKEAFSRWTVVEAEEPLPIGIWWAAPGKGGLLLGDMDQEGAGWKAGLRPGDILSAVEGKPVSSREDFISLRTEFQSLKSGDRRTLSVVRAGTGKKEDVAIPVELTKIWKPVRR